LATATPFAFVGCGFTELGVKVGTERRIPDKHITSSSQKDGNHAAYRGRVGIEVIGSWEDGWCSSQTDPAPYIQVFFGECSRRSNGTPTHSGI